MSVEERSLAAYLVGIHRYCYKAGKPGKITGVRLMPIGAEQRPCFEVEYEDGAKDTVPIYKEPHFYKIISAIDILRGNIPEVTE